MSGEEIADIKKRLDIVEYIGARIELKRQGRNFAVCCPFHQEKTASMIISPDKQSFHCFGCQKGGDIFTFAMEYDSLSFKEALQQLADEAGVTLSHRKFIAKDAAEQEREDARDKALQTALEYFRSSFQQSAGIAARDYIQKRGFDHNSIDAWEVGWAPDLYDGLLDWCKRRAVSTQALLDAGLAKEREKGGFFDFFRGRLMFPVRSPEGKLVGFGGRVLQAAEGPKYLNSPESPLFEKRRLLYGMNLCKDSIREHRHFLMMEGYTDVMMVHQHHVGPAVATLGTAMTDDHVRYIRRFNYPVYLVYDSDKAGKQAAARALPFFIKHDLEGRVLLLPEGQDPCDFLLKSSKPKEAWNCLKEESLPLFEYRIKQLKEQADNHSTETRIRIAETVMSEINLSSNEMRRDVYCEELAKQLDLPSSAMRKGKQPASKKDVGSQRQSTPSTVRPKPIVDKDACYYLLAILLADDGLIADFDDLASRFLKIPKSANGKILKAWSDAHQGPHPVPRPTFVETLTETEQDIFNMAGAEDLPEAHRLKSMMMEKIRELSEAKAGLEDLKAELESAQVAGDKQRCMEILTQITKIRRES